jgi:hypothetical protein
MFAELPKIFDKNFALNYFFPSFIFIVLAGYIFQIAGITQNILPYLDGELLNDLSVIALFSYLGGILLLITNRELYRFLEGYGKLNPFRLISRFERSRYQKIVREVEVLDKQYFSPNFSDKSRMKRTALMEQISNRFPDKEYLLLPTPFGNILRSFEVYPRVMYGIEYIDSWSRLQAVMPSEYRALVDNAKAETDLWVNFQVLTTLLIIQTGCFLSITRIPLLLLFLLIFFYLNIFSMGRAISHAFGWGDYVKSSFDIFVPKLRETLGFPLAKNREAERKQWIEFSQAIIFRLPFIMPEAKKTDGKPRRTNKKRQPKSGTLKSS